MRAAKVLSAIFGLAVAAGTIVAPTAFAECNRDQAYNKMMAFNQAWMKYQQAYSALPMQEQGAQFQKFSSGVDRMSKLSAKLATNEWNTVCQGYDALAKEFGFDLKKSAQGMLTMADLRKDGGRRGGQCGVGDAAKKFMEMFQRFQDKKANGDTTLAEEEAFRAAADPLGPEMNRNPSAVCAKVAEISKEFGLAK